MRASFHPASGSRRLRSWPRFLAQMKTASLTLVGFDGEELTRMYDALEACARSKDVQTVELFIRTLKDVSEDPTSVAPGLCLVRVPDRSMVRNHRMALLALSCLRECDAVAVVSVLRPQASGGEVLKAVGRDCPFYLNIDSGISDFASMFGTYLFPAAEPHGVAEFSRPRTGPGSRRPTLWQPREVPFGSTEVSPETPRQPASAHVV